MKAPALELNLGTIGLGLGLGAIALVGIYLAARNAGAIGELTGRAAGDAAGGLVLGLGDSIGIPRTDLDECERAIAEGRTWDASFACPAGRFLRSIFSSSGSAPERLPSPYSINPRDRT